MRRAGWILPVVQGKRLTLFDREHLREAWYRFRRVGMEFLKEEAARISPGRRIGGKKPRRDSVNPPLGGGVSLGRGKGKAR